MNKTKTTNNDWNWYFEMSLLETMEFKFVGELFFDNSDPMFICILTHLKVPGKSELVPILYHGKAKVK